MSAIVNERYTKGVSFLSNMVYKRVKGWTSGRSPPGGWGWSEQARFFRGVARIFPEVPTNFQNPSPKLLKAPNIFLVPWLKVGFRFKPKRFLLYMKWWKDVSCKIIAPFFGSSTEKPKSFIID